MYNIDKITRGDKTGMMRDDETYPFVANLIESFLVFELEFCHWEATL